VILLFPGSALAQRLAVTSSVANVRSGPGTSHDVLWQVEKYYPFKVLKKERRWYYFKDFEGDRGWLHESLVGKIKSVVTIKSSCNIRSGPGTGYAIVFTVERGTPFKVVGQEKRWLKIEHARGYRGWIHKSLVW
jgi:SH3-like domain-containing protein